MLSEKETKLRKLSLSGHEARRAKRELKRITLMKMTSFYGRTEFYYTLIFIVSYREQQIAKYIEEPWIKNFQQTSTAKHRQEKHKLPIVIE